MRQSRDVEARLQEYLIRLSLRVGDRLPGERDLATGLGVGRAALRVALDSLEAAGVVARRPQSGTFLIALPTPPARGARIAVIAPFGHAGVPGREATDAAWLHRVVSAFERTAGAAGAVLSFHDQSGQANDPCSVKDRARAAVAEGVGAAVLIHQTGTRATISHALALLHDAGVHPVIVSARTFPGMASQVYFDSVWGAYLATRYLLNRGHERIGFVGAPAGHEWVRERQQGWASSLEAAEAHPEEQWVFLPDGGVPSERLPAESDGAEALDAFLALADSVHPTAVLAANDTVALGLLRRAAVLGITLPGRLSVVGFDNDPGALLAGLTTVERPAEALGEAAARTTLERLAAGPNAATVTHRIRPVIIERASVTTI